MDPPGYPSFTPHTYCEQPPPLLTKESATLSEPDPAGSKGWIRIDGYPDIWVTEPIFPLSVSTR